MLEVKRDCSDVLERRAVYLNCLQKLFLSLFFLHRVEEDRGNARPEKIDLHKKSSMPLDRIYHAESSLSF